MSTKDQYETPMDLFKTLDREFDFGHDVCAEYSTTKCPICWTEEDDALSKDWHQDSNKTFGRYLWCNPPYSNIKPWVDKAITAQLNGTGTVMLVMCDPSVAWFARALEYCSEVRFITKGRISFMRDGVKASGNNKGSCIFVFDPHRVGWCDTHYVERDQLMRVK